MNAAHYDRERDRVRRAAWRAKNHEKAASYQRAYSAANREWLTPIKVASTLRWRRSNPSEARESSRRASQLRRARLGMTERSLTKEQWFDVLETFDHRCAYCLIRSSQLHQEHVIPMSHGGGYTADNIVPACPKCNRYKWNRGPLSMVNWRVST